MPLDVPVPSRDSQIQRMAAASRETYFSRPKGVSASVQEQKPAPRLQFPNEISMPSEPVEEQKLAWWKTPAEKIGEGLETLTKPFVWVNETFEKPWAGLLVLAAQGLKPDEQSMEKAFRERRPDESVWEVLRRGYEDTDIGWFGKFALEMTAPIWWVFPSGAISNIVGKFASGATKVPLIKTLLSNPVLKKLGQESASSLAFNAPKRTKNVLTNLFHYYSAAGLDDAGKVAYDYKRGAERLLQDIVAGKMDPKIQEKFVLDLTTKASGKNGVGMMKTVDDLFFKEGKISQQVRDYVASEVKYWTTSTDDIAVRMDKITEAIGGQLRYAYSDIAGIPHITPTNMLGDAFKFWKAGVLSTPTYVMQNLVEDKFRLILSSLEPANYKGWDILPLGLPIPVKLPTTIAGKTQMKWSGGAARLFTKGFWNTTLYRDIDNIVMMPQELQNMLIPTSARLEGFTTANEYAAYIDEAIRSINEELVIAHSTRGNSELVREYSHTRYKLQRLREVAVKTDFRPAQRDLVNAAATQAASGSTMYVADMPFIRGMDAMAKPFGSLEDILMQGIDKVRFGGQVAEAKQLARLSKGRLRKELFSKVAEAPLTLAAHMDAQAYAKIWVYNHHDWLDTHPSATINGITDFAFRPETVTEMKAAGYSSGFIKELQKGYSRHIAAPDAHPLEFFENWVERMPHLGLLSKSQTIPQHIVQKYQPQLRLAAATNDPKRMKETIASIDNAIKRHYFEGSPSHDDLVRALIDDFGAHDDDVRAISAELLDIDSRAKAASAKLLEMEREVFGKVSERDILKESLFQLDAIQRQQEASALAAYTLSRFHGIKPSSPKYLQMKQELLTPWKEGFEVIQQRKSNLAGLLDRFTDSMKGRQPDSPEVSILWENMRKVLYREYPELDVILQFMPVSPTSNEIWTMYQRGVGIMLDRNLQNLRTKLKFGQRNTAPLSHLYHQAHKELDMVRKGLTGDMANLFDAVDELSPSASRVWRSMSAGTDAETTMRTVKLTPDDYEKAIKELEGIGAVKTTSYTSDMAYDRKTRSWITQVKDNEGNKVGEAFHVATKQEAVAAKEILARGFASKRELVKNAPRRASWKKQQAIFDKISTETDQLRAINKDAILSEQSRLTQASLYATNRAYSTMGNYSETTNLDAIMGQIFPFWYFPSRSLPFYAKTFAEKPFLLADMQRYAISAQQNTDVVPESLIGYFPLKIGDQYMYLNPLRPWMGYQLFGMEPLAGAGQPILGQVQQAFGMIGFGMHPALTWSMEGINKITATQGVYLTRGELQPLFPQERWVQDLIGVTTGKWMATPEQALFAQTIEGLPDWERRQQEKEIARTLNINPELAEQWQTPRHLINAARSGNTIAIAAYEDAVKRLSRYGLLSAALPIYNRRNAQEIEMYTDRDKLLNDLFIDNGYTQEQIDERIKTAKRIGFSPMMYLNQQQRRAIYEAHPEWEPWQGLTRVGITPEERSMEEQTNKFFETYDEARSQMADNLQVADDAFLNGYITGYDWRMRYQDIQAQNASLWQMLVGDGKAPDAGGNSGMLPLARVTNERVDYFREKYGSAIPPVHPEDEALNYYYSLSPEMDAYGMYDFDTYHLQRDQFLKGISASVRDYILEDVKRPRFSSSVERMYREDLQKIESYLSVRRIVQQEYPVFSVLEERLKREQDPLQRIALQKELNYYERIVSERRQTLRLQNARLEAVLFKWGYISTFVNPETATIFDKV